MINREEMLRFLRSLAFLFGAIIIIYISLIPGDFSGKTLPTSSFLFAWAGAFVMRRPNSVNALVLAIISVIYFVYVDEGVQLDALALVAFILLVQHYHTRLTYQSFWIEWFVIGALYLGLQLIRSFVLFAFFTPRPELYTILGMTLFFFIAYPVLNFTIYIFIRPRKTMHS